MRCTPFILIGIFVSAIYASAAVAQMSKGDQVSKGGKAAAQRSTRDSCPAGFPLACPGTDSCCPSDMPNLCKSLTRAHPQGRRRLHRSTESWTWRISRGPLPASPARTAALGGRISLVPVGPPR